MAATTQRMTPEMNATIHSQEFIQIGKTLLKAFVNDKLESREDNLFITANGPDNGRITGIGGIHSTSTPEVARGNQTQEIPDRPNR